MVKLSLCLITYALRNESVWGSRCIDPHILELGAKRRSVVSFMPRPLYPCTNRTGDWVGSRTDLDDVEKRKISPQLGLEVRPLGIQPIARRYIDCATQV
jgi:hypothetical protein